jgi:uncharacterized RDD family membrane protein YckC
MTNPSAGWYPDPAPESAPGRLRYWDGGRWTEHVHDPEPVPTYPGSYPQYPQASTEPYGVATAPARKTTPDGVPLSGWWWRVLARVLDGFILIPVYILVVIPVVASQWDELSNWVDQVNYAADHDLSSPPLPDLFDTTTGPGIALALSLLAANVIWELVFLAWKQATPGKLIVGLRVRRREAPGLPWSSIVRRVGFVVVLSLFAEVPVLGVLAGLVVILDYLWPLWDGKKQALHDKVAGTNVVRPDQVPVTVAGASPPPRW